MLRLGNLPIFQRTLEKSAVVERQIFNALVKCVSIPNFFQTGVEVARSNYIDTCCMRAVSQYFLTKVTLSYYYFEGTRFTFLYKENYAENIIL